MNSEKTERYADIAYNSESIPPLPSTKRRNRSGDELQPWGNYSAIDPHEKIIVDVSDLQACEADDPEFHNDQWWGWTHRRISFINQKMGLKGMLFLVPIAWIATIFIGLFLLFLNIIEWLAYTVKISDILLVVIIGVGSFIYIGVALYLVYLTTNWVISEGLGFLLKPFETSLQKKGR